MKNLLVASLCLAVAVALPYDVVQDQEGQEYYLVPVSRVRRDTKDGKLEGKYQDTIFEKGDHKVDATVYGSKNFLNRKDPAKVGGQLDYTYRESGLAVKAEHTEHRGTDLGIEGKYNVYRNGPFHVDVTGGYNRHYGGPRGTQHPSFDTMLSGSYDFH